MRKNCASVYTRVSANDCEERHRDHNRSFRGMAHGRVISSILINYFKTSKNLNFIKNTASVKISTTIIVSYANLHEINLKQIEYRSYSNQNYKLIELKIKLKSKN